MTERGAARTWILAFVVMAGGGLAALLLIGRLVGANKLPGETRANPTSTDGRSLYFEATCAGCHGADGKGSRGPSLVSGSVAQLSLEEIMAKIRNGRRLGGMPKFEGVLTEQQIRAVAEYVVSLREAS